jgi:hypothetical protein
VDKEQYRIHLAPYYDEYFPVTDKQTLLTLKELEMLIEALSQLARKAKTLNTANPIMDLLLDKIRLSETEWTFKPTPKSIEEAGSCVYFIHVRHAHPYFKIGRSAHLNKRLASHRYYLSPDLRLIAFVTSPNFKQLEKAFHCAFAQYRVGTELFEAEPVWDFLYSVEQDWLK